MSSPRLPVFGAKKQSKKRSRRCKTCGSPVGRSARLYCSSICFISDKSTRRRLQEEFIGRPCTPKKLTYTFICRKPSRYDFDNNY